LCHVFAHGDESKFLYKDKHSHDMGSTGIVHKHCQALFNNQCASTSFDVPGQAGQQVQGLHVHVPPLQQASQQVQFLQLHLVPSDLDFVSS
jgi:hypothetical protein